MILDDDYYLNQIVADNLKLQIALQEKSLYEPMFTEPIDYGSYNIFNNDLVPFELSPTSYSFGGGCCAGPPRDVRTVPCCVLQSGYRPSEESYCCNTCLPTDLEIENKVLQTIAPYQAKADYQQYKCCCKK